MKSFPAASAPQLTSAEALRLAFELFELGESAMRQNLRRRHPGASEAEVERLLVAWLHERPGAEFGDASGRPCTRPSLET